MATLIHWWVEACRAGTNPRTVCRTTTGWVVMGESQFLRGYCLLLPDPVAGHLNLIPAEVRRELLYQATLLGDALLSLTDAVRCNYEILGNLEPAVHVHVIPRYDHEPEELRTRPVWFYDWDQAPRFDPLRDADLMKGIRAYLQRAGVAA